MRFAVLTITLLLLAAPAMAQDQSVGHNYGGVTCPTHIACSEDASQIMTIANACVVQYFGFTNADGFFDEALGLDFDNCLTTKSDALPKLASTKTVPHCCVAETNDNMCAVHCDLVSSQ